MELLDNYVIDDLKSVQSSAHDEEEQTTTFKFITNFKIQFCIKIIHELNEKMSGFYRSSYQKNHKTKYSATTQMQTTDCRRAFPSFDELNLKAKFTIASIGKKSTYLSNMDVKQEEKYDSGKFILIQLHWCLHT